MALSTGVGLTLIPLLVLTLYIYRNDRVLRCIPPRAQKLIGKRMSAESIEEVARKQANCLGEDTDVHDLPPKTGRRYIVVGGGGFVGGVTVAKLVGRGEPLENIRILDVRPPSNPRAAAAVKNGVQFISADITNAAALEAAFKAPWPSSSSANDPEITVFHHVAEIRFYERHAQFLEKSRRVNITGTQNVIAASRAAGATVLIYTSSGSIGIHRSHLLLWPWEKEPKHFVQIINDDDSRLPTRDEDFFSNYAVVKAQADRIVRAADKTVLESRTATDAKKVMRTGVVRPGQAIYGPQDAVCHVYMANGVQPSWIENSIQSFIYVDNAVAAHLCYEARLIELLNGGTNPDIGGQAFTVTDPGPTPTYGDIFTILETRTKGECRMFSISPTAMLMFGYAMETYYRIYHGLLDAGWTFVRFLPPVKGPIVSMQPAVWHLLSVHVLYDDSRARLAPEKGGLGYTGKWTSLEGWCKTIEYVKKSRSSIL